VPFGRWQPTRFVRFEEAFDTSVGTSIVVTDAGKAYLKALGNRQGPHALVCEWVGTRLADWFGLATFDYADVSRLIAMDHTHCFTCGSDLDASVANIETVRDPRVFGLFPAFVPLADKAVVQATCDRLREMTADAAQDVVASVPETWEVSAGARIALRDFIVQRAGFVADNMIDWLGPLCWPQAELDLM
jgi:hypothetical protein